MCSVSGVWYLVGNLQVQLVVFGAFSFSAPFAWVTLTRQTSSWFQVQEAHATLFSQMALFRLSTTRDYHQIMLQPWIKMGCCHQL